MKALIDLIIINIVAIISYLSREGWGHFPVEAPSFFVYKYLFVLVALNVLYLFLFWLLGAYDKRQKRALLEEFILIFGVISSGLFVLITFLFMGKMWWMSRGILYMFWFISILALSFSRVYARSKIELSKSLRIDWSELEKNMGGKKQEIEKKLKDRLSIIIVNTNEAAKLARCLRSIKKANIQLPIEVIVVDNCSTDGTLELLKKEYPRVRLVSNPSNLGYPTSVNNGLRASAADYCLILNPDIIVLPGAIEIMLRFLIDHPKAGVVGCKLLNEDGTLQFSVRRFLDLRIYLYRFTPLRGLMTGSMLERFYLMQDWDHNDNRVVDWVLGGCMLAKRSAFREVGMMDEKIFLYFDDVDWCYRMWERGWQVAYVAEAAMIHKHVRTSANKLFNRATYEHFKSLIYFLRKHGVRLPANCPSSTE